ncbi:MAG: A/G-specific adenine glycosylase [Chloroflexi bacterium]|nr:A/G-specific adenine glycosylase [Chloroflexota bacterium]
MCGAVTWPMSMPALRRDLLIWFEENARDLPWRRDPSPYHTWVSETMLQQTQVTTVVPYYNAFINRFPYIAVLADATLDDVLKTWEGLGYYRRARNLHKAAGIVVSEHGGELPDDEQALLALPGIGRYTAGAIRSIAFALPAPILDGNVKRVITRLDDIEENIDNGPVERKLWQRASELVDPKRPGVFNEAVMELGATICLPQKPLCLLCPVQKHCLAQDRGTQYERPVRNQRRKVPHYDVVAGIIWHAGDSERFMIAQRPAEGMLGGLWEFPGGKQEPGEHAVNALVRELEEELAIEVEVGEHLLDIDHAFTHFRITLHAYHVRHIGGEPQCLGVDDWRWVTLPELDGFAFARTDRRIIEALQGRSVGR